MKYVFTTEVKQRGGSLLVAKRKLNKIIYEPNVNH